MVLKRSLSLRHDLREKWLETTFKLQKISAFKVLAGISILSTVLKISVKKRIKLYFNFNLFNKNSKSPLKNLLKERDNQEVI